MKRHIVSTSLLGIMLTAAYVLWRALGSECPTDEFIAVALIVPVSILLATYIVAGHWPALDIKPIVFIIVGHVCAFVAYQVVMASYGYSRHLLSVAFEALVWVFIAALTLSLRIYGAVKLIESDMA